MILCEKEDKVGGILKSEQALPFKYEMYQLSGTYAKLAKDAGVEFRLNTEVTRAYVEQEAPDALIIAVGSTPLVPPIPGLQGDNVVVVNNYYLEKDKVTDDVVVFGIDIRIGVRHPSGHGREEGPPGGDAGTLWHPTLMSATAPCS